MKRAIIAFSLVLVVGVSVRADVPQQINHQGVVSVNGTPFNGAGLFRFAIVKTDNPNAGKNLWCNDDNDPAAAPENCAEQVGIVPTNAVSIAVTNGVYTVRLGDPGLANMTALPSALFNNANTALRIWFDDGINGNQQLTPDHVLTPSPYSHVTAFQPPIGAIIAWHRDIRGVGDPLPLPDGWIECTQNLVGDLTINVPGSPLNGLHVPALNNSHVGYNGGRFLRGGTSSGTLQFATTVRTHAGTGRLSGFPSTSDDDGINVGGGGQYHVGLEIPGGDQVHYVQFRPVNMSVVWIMRVK